MKPEQQSSNGEHHENTHDRFAIGAVMRELRMLRQLTQRELAAKTGMAQNFICLVENGGRNLSHESIATLAEVLDVPASWLYILATESQDSTEAPAVLELIQAARNGIREHLGSSKIDRKPPAQKLSKGAKMKSLQKTVEDLQETVRVLSQQVQDISRSEESPGQ